jgi:hypothetical protein
MTDCLKATTYANEAGLRIYGYYQAIPSVQSQGPGPVGEKILAKLRQTTPEAFGLLVRFGGLACCSTTHRIR